MLKLTTIRKIAKVLPFLIFIILPADGNAQNRPPPQTSILVEAKVLKDNINETEIELKFDRAVQRFGTITQGEVKTILDLPFTRRGTGLKLPSDMNGFVSNIALSESGTAQQIQFISKSIAISKSEKRGRSIFINIKAKNPQRSANSEISKEQTKLLCQKQKIPRMAKIFMK